MLRKLFIVVIFIVGLAFIFNEAWADVPRDPSVVYVEGKRLMVERRLPDGTLGDAKPYIIKGVTWSPATRSAAEGPNPLQPGENILHGFFFNYLNDYGQIIFYSPDTLLFGNEIFDYWLKDESQEYYIEDIALMKEMNVNTVRVYTDFGEDPEVYNQILDEFYNNDIMVIMTVAMSRPDLDGNGFDVYLRYLGPSNHYIPSGWMGDGDDLQFNDQASKDASSQETCIRIHYTAEESLGNGWAGIYWQSTEHNWGQDDGYNLSRFNRLVFKARGDNGGEKIDKVKVGGITGDTADVEYGPITLTADWEEYFIDLRGEDLSDIRGGFCITFNAEAAGGAQTIFLDDIYYTNDIGVKSYEKIVELYKRHPAILMWSLGNEWNLAYNLYQGGYESVREAGEATQLAANKIKVIDPNHPVSSCLGDRFGDEVDIPGNRIDSVVETCSDVDIWGLNIYRGDNFNGLFVEWQGVSSKPFYLSEFGTDSFSTVAYHYNEANQAYDCFGQEDQAMQSSVNLSLWDEVKEHLSAFYINQPCVGGLIHEFNDELWKVGNFHVGLGGDDLVDYHGPDDEPGTGDDDSSYDEYNSEGFFLKDAHPDDVANEEYFGVVTADRVRKDVFDELKDYYGTILAPVIISITELVLDTDKPIRKDTVDITATIQNQGGVLSGSFEVEFIIWHIDKDGEKLELAHIMEEVFDLDPNETVVVPYSWAEIEDIGLRRIEVRILPLAESGSEQGAEDGMVEQTHVVVDIDGDNDIDIADIMKVAVIWHTEEGDERFNPIYDLNNSGRIDIVDIMLVAIKWGTELPE
ncbi:MAG: hypothetical protein KKG01_01500 [Candidatus Omnitrophica bacterium]|nr:hypothetical protein [Candidatus Omnitrophota bacterium]